MKKILKVIGLIIIAIILCWTILFTVDFIRLKDSRKSEKPIVTIHSSKTLKDSADFEETFDSLGYSISYSSYQNNICSSEFKIFGKTIYAWIE